MYPTALHPYIPTTASYQIWHPQNFIVDENEEAIVTITAPNGEVNLTLSAYSVNQKVTEQILLNFFDSMVKDYTCVSERKRSVTEERIWLEGRFVNNNVSWVWWAISQSNQIIMASSNSAETLSQEDYQLFVFMLDKMEIYPDEQED